MKDSTKVYIKRIIAREGLIIIGLFILSVSGFVLNEVQHAAIRDFKAEAQTFELGNWDRPFIDDLGLVENKDANNKENRDDLLSKRRFFTGAGTYVLFPEGVDSNIINRTIKKDFPDKDVISSSSNFTPIDDLIIQYYDKQGNRAFTGLFYKLDFKILGAVLPLLAYSLYLIIRFIIWAISILRTKGEKIARDESQESR